MKKIKAFTISAPLAIIALVVLIAVGGYLTYTVYQSNQVEQSSTNNQQSTINEQSSTPSTNDDTTNSSDRSDSSDETTDWQSYTNDQYGFSFKYPKEWGINKNAQSNNRELLVAFNVKNYGVAGNSFTIYHSVAEIGIVPNTTIGGKKAVKGDRLQGIESQNQSVRIQLDDGSYINIFVEGSALDDLDQILSAFEFINTSSKSENDLIDQWLENNKDTLNKYGDTIDTVYAGGTPLFNIAGGSSVNLYDYIISKHPDKPWSK